MESQYKNQMDKVHSANVKRSAIEASFASKKSQKKSSKRESTGSAKTKMPYGFWKDNQTQKMEFPTDFDTHLTKVFNERYIKENLKKDEIVPMTVDTAVYDLEPKANAKD